MGTTCNPPTAWILPRGAKHFTHTKQHYWKCVWPVSYLELPLCSVQSCLLLPKLFYLCFGRWARGMMKNHSDRRFRNVDTLRRPGPALWTWWWNYINLYPLPSENYLLCSRGGPTTRNKAAGGLCLRPWTFTKWNNLRLSPFSSSQSELNPLYIQTGTLPPSCAPERSHSLVQI